MFVACVCESEFIGVGENFALAVDELACTIHDNPALAQVAVHLWAEGDARLRFNAFWFRAVAVLQHDTRTPRIVHGEVHGEVHFAGIETFGFQLGVNMFGISRAGFIGH